MTSQLSADQVKKQRSHDHDISSVISGGMLRIKIHRVYISTVNWPTSAWKRSLVLLSIVKILSIRIQICISSYVRVSYAFWRKRFITHSSIEMNIDNFLVQSRFKPHVLNLCQDLQQRNWVSIWIPSIQTQRVVYLKKDKKLNPFFSSNISNTSKTTHRLKERW